MLPEVMQAVCGTVPQSTPATLKGYRRSHLRHRQYPGIVQDETCEVEGLLYNNMTEIMLHKLDVFEGSEYSKATNTVHTQTAEITPATFYVLTPEHEALMTEDDWDLDFFKTHHLSEFLAHDAQ